MKPQPRTLMYISTHNCRNYETFNIIVQNTPLATRDTKMNNIIKAHKSKGKRQHKS